MSEMCERDLENTPLLLDRPSRANGKESSGRLSDGLPVTLRGKKILLATESLGPINGVSRTTSMLIEHLRRNGVQVVVVAPEIKSTAAKTHPDLHVDVRLSGYALPYNPDLTVVYPFNINRVFERTFQPDLIYLASPASVGFQALIQLRQLSNGSPVLCNFQTDLASYGDIILPNRMHQYSAWLLGLVQGYLFRHSTVQTIFYPSTGIRKYLESIGVQHDKLVHLGRGVDTTLFDPARRDLEYRRQLAPHREVILITVSRLAPEKGFEFLSKAVIRLAEEGVSFRLVIVGGNRNASVEAEVRRHFDPVMDRVVFTGFLTGTALARVYATADVFLHCSITETFGLVVLEAMASGVPVVARDQGGPSDIVRHGHTGYLTRPHDVDEFVSRVRQLSEHDDVRAAFAHKSREVASETTWEKINDKAAQQMAVALEQHRDRELSLHRVREAHSRVSHALHIACRQFVLPIWVHLKLFYATAIISGFWMIAVLPLIVHGTLIYRSS